ncbi:MAG: arginine repressor [Ruminococcus sp.]|nr:arginine repressor [Ruminococcus sp.]
MKNERQQLILELIRTEKPDTQDALRELLMQRGCSVTQATLSRDMKELSLIKVTDDSGRHYYAVPRLSREGLSKENAALLSLVRESVISVDSALNTVVIKCHVGMAQAVCAKLDTMEIENSVGTIAGDDTIFMLMRSEKDAQRLVRELGSIISDKQGR